MKKGHRQWRSSDRQPVRETNPVIGVVWSVPAYEIAEAVIPEIEKRLDQDKLNCGPEIRLYGFFSVEDKEGPCMVLLGLGTMFDANFLAGCGACICRHEGDRLPESPRVRKLIQETRVVWEQEGRKARKKVRARIRAEQDYKKHLGSNQ